MVVHVATLVTVTSVTALAHKCPVLKPMQRHSRACAAKLTAFNSVKLHFIICKKISRAAGWGWCHSMASPAAITCMQIEIGLRSRFNIVHAVVWAKYSYLHCISIFNSNFCHSCFHAFSVPQAQNQHLHHDFMQGNFFSLMVYMITCNQSSLVTCLMCVAHSRTCTAHASDKFSKHACACVDSVVLARVSRVTLVRSCMIHTQ